MLGRPNLSRLHCDRFSVFFHLNIPPEVASKVLLTTHNHRDDDGKIFAYYGKSYRYEGISYVAQASAVSHDPDYYHLNFIFSISDRGKPPPGYESPDKLLEIALENAPDGLVEFDILSNFTYELNDGWSPRLPLPIVLTSPIRTARGRSFTHMDGVRLSSKMDEKTPEWIQMEVTDNGEITHEVGILREIELNSNTIRSLFREAGRLSLSMVTGKGDNSDGD